MHWVVVWDVQHRSLWLAGLLAVITRGIGALAARNVLGLVTGTFLPYEPAATAPVTAPAAPPGPTAGLASAGP
jgi:hypothetical protein